MAGNKGILISDFVGSNLGDVKISKVYLGSEEVVDFDPEPTPSHNFTTLFATDFEVGTIANDAATFRYYSASNSPITLTYPGDMVLSTGYNPSTYSNSQYTLDTLDHTARSSSYIHIPGVNAQVMTADEITVELWVYKLPAITGTGNGMWFTIHRTTGTPNLFYFTTNPRTGSVTVNVYTSNGNNVGATHHKMEGDSYDNQWHHICMILNRTNNTLRVGLDGVFAYTALSATPLDPSGSDYMAGFGALEANNKCIPWPVASMHYCLGVPFDVDTENNTYTVPTTKLANRVSAINTYETTFSLPIKVVE